MSIIQSMFHIPVNVPYSSQCSIFQSWSRIAKVGTPKVPVQGGKAVPYRPGPKGGTGTVPADRTLPAEWTMGSTPPNACTLSLISARMCLVS